MTNKLLAQLLMLEIMQGKPNQVDMYQVWINSIIDNNIEKMREYAEDNDYYEGWENGSNSWEIHFTIRQTITIDRGDYYTQSITSAYGIITGTLIIHSAEDKETEHYFEREFKEN